MTVAAAALVVATTAHSREGEHGDQQAEQWAIPAHFDFKLRLQSFDTENTQVGSRRSARRRPRWGEYEAVLGLARNLNRAVTGQPRAAATRSGAGETVVLGTKLIAGAVDREGDDRPCAPAQGRRSRSARRHPAGRR